MRIVEAVCRLIRGFQTLLLWVSPYMAICLAYIGETKLAIGSLGVWALIVTNMLMIKRSKVAL